MNRKIWLVVGACSLLVVIILGGFYIWFLKQQPKIITGTARPDFPYTNYSLDELNNLYPQTLYEDVTTTQTPEETHAKFIAALKKEDFDEAVNCCFFEEDREAMLNEFIQIKKDGNLDVMIEDLSNINKDMLLDTIGVYSYEATIDTKGSKGASFMEFNKNQNGVWLIKSL